MLVNPFEIKDYLGEARERYTLQWSDKPVFDSYVRLLLEGAIELQEVVGQVMTQRSLDVAEGKQLDILGDIVGQPRQVISADLIEFFGFYGHPASLPYGTVNDPTRGGVYYSYGGSLAGNILLDDYLYRIFIRAKIASNSFDGSPDRFLRSLALVFGEDTTFQISEGSATIHVSVGRPLTLFEHALFDLRVINTQGQYTYLLPRPAGVTLTYEDTPMSP